MAIDKIEKIKAKKAKAKAKSKAKKAIKKAEANFDLDLPDGFDDSSDDGSVMTVVSPEDRRSRTGPRHQLPILEKTQQR